jgi:hypothetical protein
MVSLIMAESQTGCYTARPTSNKLERTQRRACTPGSTITNRSRKNFSTIIAIMRIGKPGANLTNRDQITAAVATLRTAQGGCNSTGRLNEAFKDEERNLVRQLEKKK